MQDKPRYRHFEPPMKGDEFLYQCGDIDVWMTSFTNGPLGNGGRIDITLRHADQGANETEISYTVCSTVLQLEQLGNDPLYQPLLARAKLTGKYP